MISDRDISEIDALDTLVNSDGWRLVAARAVVVLEGYRDALERERDATVAAEYRGAASALRTVLTLPAILKAEYEAEAKK